MGNRIFINQVLVANALSIAKRLLNNDGIFDRIEKASRIVDKVIANNLKAQEYYGASIKKLAFVHSNKNLIFSLPLSFDSVSLVENGFNSLVLMARACLDSMACTINLAYGDKLKEFNVKPLDPEFLKTVHNERIKTIIKENIKAWRDIDEYRNLIIHRTAVLILPTGKNLGSIEYFGVVKNPTEFISNINAKEKNKHILKVNHKINEIVELTQKTFINISNAFGQTI